ncbi:MAG: DUF5007 domain-containing protein [Bacteroidota bacterium]|nr:DUF5007 domain-containing protein [Bacteroidota bacterium]
MQYSNKLFVVPQGQIASSNSLVSDGSTIPLNIQWVHIYDSTGKNVDDIFNKTYPVGVWSSAYDPLTDTTYALIVAKRTMKDLPPIQLNSTSGVLTSNSATLNVPAGNYTLDVQVKNSVGTEIIKNAITIDIQAVAPLQVTEVSAIANGKALAGTAPVSYFFNGQNNPFVSIHISRFADTPNVLILKYVDRNGTPFDPKTGEIIKRPAAGLNPNPPFLQNLQVYAPDTYVATDTAMTIKFPLAPFPIASLGNGFNMYYNIKSSAVLIDSTLSWTSNPSGAFYQGTSDSHYLGVYTPGKYDYSIRVPMRIEVPGSYQLNVKILNVVHSE